MLYQGDIAAADDRLWRLWSDTNQSVAVPPASEDPDLSALLLSFSNAVHADAVVLTLHSDDEDGGSTILDTLGCKPDDGALAAEVAALAEIFTLRGPGGEDVAVDRAWLGALPGRRDVRVLRLPVRSRRGRSRIVLNALYRRGPAPVRSALTGAVRGLFPVIDAYLRLWQRSRAEERVGAGLRGSLDMMEIGIVLLDRKARILFANGSADDMLRGAALLRRSGSTISAVALGNAMKLQVALNHAIACNLASQTPGSAGRASAMLRLAGKGGKSLIVSVVPNGEPAAQAGAVAATVLLLDPALDTTKMLQPVCKLHGLSPVESQLACHLTAGASLQEAADRMRIKEQTARTYLKQVFTKTETSRQSGLVRLMLSSLVPVRSKVAPEVF